ncbi:hypothetical protein IHE45_11G000100 [Dioscorea alata]|uniref:Uncharacterized protein n=3 Tax=Dioscorea alata TaxID=55571 RepID=A0ACB7V441_DIOAL|nr:hypothetical protein IHE45_11G000100 [Dioscorea alata]KAH7668253.1 hypothetical protein IHE45_11G000100 [Dioscorea alata]KAH7668255.1 hypothetical protein IHE45_11G000100 [Dioscorea alata]
MPFRGLIFGHHHSSLGISSSASYLSYPRLCSRVMNSILMNLKVFSCLFLLIKSVFSYAVKLWRHFSLLLDFGGGTRPETDLIKELK